MGLGDLGLLVVILKEFSLLLFFSGTKLVRKWQIVFQKWVAQVQTTWSFCWCS